MTTIRFDGGELAGGDGRTIAGILLEHGIVSWRTAAGAERGIFCGIGVCHDCLVTVDGVEGVRACQREAVDGAVVEREERA